MKNQVTLKVAKYTDETTYVDYYVHESINGEFSQSWGPYLTQSAADSAAYEIGSLELFPNAEVTVITSERVHLIR